MKTEIEHSGAMEISSTADLIEFAISTSNAFSHVVWFRGHSIGSPKWKLIPSAFRRFPSSEHEQAASQNFCRHAPARHSSTPQPNDYAAWLCLMQHYGLPTRLLDWTESILVAAYFAVSDLSNENDAAIFALSPIDLNRSAKMGYIPMLSNLETQGRVRPAFFEQDKESDVIAAIMPDIDQRMFLQQGVFTLHTTRTPLEELPQSETFLRKGVIPVIAKKRIEWELRICGFSRAKLFPDLGNLAIDLVDQQVRRIKH